MTYITGQNAAVMRTTDRMQEQASSAEAHDRTVSIYLSSMENKIVVRRRCISISPGEGYVRSKRAMVD